MFKNLILTINREIVRPLVRLAKKYGKYSADRHYGEWEEWQYGPIYYAAHICGDYVSLFGIRIYQNF